MADEPAAQIADQHAARHNHYDELNVNRCTHCQAFVSPDERSPGVIQYQCHRCGLVTETKKQAISRLSRA